MNWHEFPCLARYFAPNMRFTTSPTPHGGGYVGGGNRGPPDCPIAIFAISGKLAGFHTHGDRIILLNNGHTMGCGLTRQKKYDF